MDKEDVKAMLAVLGIFIIIVLVIGGFIMQPYFESRAFNKFTTGQKATYWDAVWTELRVIPSSTDLRKVGLNGAGLHGVGLPR